MTSNDKHKFLFQKKHAVISVNLCGYREHLLLNFMQQYAQAQLWTCINIRTDVANMDTLLDFLTDNVKEQVKERVVSFYRGEASAFAFDCGITIFNVENHELITKHFIADVEEEMEQNPLRFKY